MQRREQGIGTTLILLVCFGLAPLLNAESPSAQAAKVERVFAELQYSQRQGRYELTEDELNAYFQQQIRDRGPKGVESFQVKLKEGSFLAFANVNMDEVELEGGLTGGLVRTLFSGRQRLEVDGTLVSSDGKASYEVTQARLNSIRIPSYLVTSALRSIGRKVVPPVDPTRAFELPHGIKSVEVLPQKAVIRR